MKRIIGLVLAAVVSLGATQAHAAIETSTDFFENFTANQALITGFYFNGTADTDYGVDLGKAQTFVVGDPKQEGFVNVGNIPTTLGLSNWTNVEWALYGGLNNTSFWFGATLDFADQTFTQNVNRDLNGNGTADLSGTATGSLAGTVGAAASAYDQADAATLPGVNGRATVANANGSIRLETTAGTYTHGGLFTTGGDLINTNINLSFFNQDGEQSASYFLYRLNDLGTTVETIKLGTITLHENGDMDFCPTTVVPVPAAAWLLGSGLLGLVGLRRKSA